MQIKPDILKLFEHPPCLTCAKEAPNTWGEHAYTSLKVVDSSQSLEHSRDSCVSCASQRQPQYPTAGRGQTRLNFLPLHFLLFRTLLRALRGGVKGRPGRDGEEEEREGTTLGTPFPSDPSPYYCPDCKSETKQQQRLISSGLALCAYYVYWKDHYTGWTMCTCCFQPLTLQLVGRDLSLLFKHSTGYIRMNHSSHNRS